jgi:hypothetical protein
MFAQFKRVSDRCSIDCDHCKRGVDERPRFPVTRPATTVVRHGAHDLCMWLCDEHAAQAAVKEAAHDARQAATATERAA